MKKVLSILLAVVLVFGMLPASALTVFAADTTIEFALGANGAASHADGSSKTSYTETVGDYTLSITDGTNMYTGARDATGNSCIKLGTSSKTGGFSFTVPDDVTSVVIAIAKYKSSTSAVTINGTTTTLTKNSNNGEYDEITVDTSSTKTVTLATTSSGKRAMVNTITYIIPAAEGACDHESKTSLGDGYAATCTEPGKEDTYKCDNPDCGMEFPGDEIDPLGHNYVDGICVNTGCGEPEPEGYKLTDIANIKSGDIVIITMAKGGNVYAMSNNNGTSSAPTATKVTVSNNTITEAPDTVLWNVGGSADAYEFYPNGESAKWLYCTATNNGVRVGGTNSAKTFKIDAASGYLVHNGTSRYIGVYNSADWRCYTSVNTNISGQTLAFYVQSAGDSGCEECVPGTPVKEKEVDPTCTKEGSYESVTYCTECGNVITRETVTVSMIDHVYENGACTSCGKVDPSVETKAELMTTLPGSGDRIIIYNPSSKTAMGIGDADSDSKLDSASTEPVDALLPYNAAVAVLTVEIDGDYFAFKLEDGTYLATDSDGGQLSFETAASDLTLWSIASVDGLWTITSKTAENSYGAQAIEYYSGEYTTYAGSGDAFNMALYLVEKGENACTHESTTEQSDGYAATCTEPGKTNSWTCDACGMTVTAQQDIPAQGHNYEDGACTVCGAAEPERYYIAAIRGNGTAWYMTSDLGTASTKRYQAVATGILPSSIDPEKADSAYTFILTDNGDGTYYLQAEGVEGDNYLGWTSGNSGAFVAKSDDAKVVLTETADLDGTFNISLVKDDTRMLALNATAGNNYFAWYSSTGNGAKDMILIPVEEAETTTLTLYGDVDGITVNDNETLDLNGHAATNVTATKIYAYDSTATSAAAGTGSITTSSEVVMDNTVGNIRYIALAEGEEESKTYTFHVLEMKLSAVTLRAKVEENGDEVEQENGIYYKATYACDEILQNAITSYGVVFSLKDIPGADFKTETGDRNLYTVYTKENFKSGEEVTSGSIFGIMKEELDAEENAERGAMDIHANAYIEINGNVLVGSGASYSLFDVMDKLDEKWDKLSEAQQATIQKFYTYWADKGMSAWAEELPMIAG